jgi:uncharacterized NAD(P)/FAD-binding protein YdhS
MVDAAVSLKESGHRGPIVAMSGRGLLPQAHRRVDPAFISDKELPSSDKLAPFLHWLRRRAGAEMRRGGDWRSVIDGLRPYTQTIWRARPREVRRRFIEHARPWWDVHRHRLALQVETKIEALRRRGQLRVLAGRIIEVNPKPNGATVLVRTRCAAAPFQLGVSRIVSCRG